MYRIGNGYDVHRLVINRKLILGGVEIPHHKGVLGHSDGDVLIHAIMDAILGALALGDIGQHFPDTDLSYEGIDSMLLLNRVKNLMNSRGYVIGNLDTMVVAQRPKIKSFIQKMRERIAEALETEIENISVKATTEEELGFTGSEEGIKSYASVLLKRKINKNPA